MGYEPISEDSHGGGGPGRGAISGPTRGCEQSWTGTGEGSQEKRESGGHERSREKASSESRDGMPHDVSFGEKDRRSLCPSDHSPGGAT